MSIRDAFHIAWTKYRSRRIVGALTAGVASIMLVILLLLSIATTGIGKSINSIPGLSGRYLLTDFGSVNFSFDEESPEDQEQAFDYVFSPDVVREELSSVDVQITDVHRHIDLPSSFSIGDKLHIDGAPFEISTPGAFFNNPSSFAIRSNSLLEERVGEGQDLSIGEDDSIPLFINPRLLAQIEDVNFDVLGITERAREFERITGDNLGRVLTLSDIDNTVSLKARIVGIAPNDAISEQSATSYFALETLGEQQQKQVIDVFSRVAVEASVGEDEFGGFPIFGFGFGDYGIQEGETYDFFKADNASRAILEFENSKDLKLLRDEYRCSGFVPDESCREFQIIGNATLEYEDIIDEMWKGIRYVVGFFATLTGIFILIVTWKIMSESRKETGVFRAMGASKFDIAKIYLAYTAIISTIGFIMAFVGAVALAALMNNRFAPELTTQLANFSGAFGAEVSVSFIGINPLHIAAVWLFAVLVGFVGGLVPIWYNASSSPIKAIRSE